jgi:signal peptidase I
MRENLVFWAKAIVIILFLRAFLFEPFRIPSESMEETLLVGDFLIVSKLHYGARTPNTIGIPFTPFYLPGLQLPQTRLPGFSEPQRGDVAVFNYPAAQDVERGVIAEDVPIERRAPYIKRIVGVPGDTLAVTAKMLHVDGQPVSLAPTLKQGWTVRAAADARPTARQLDEWGIEFLPGSARTDTTGALLYEVWATPGEVEVLLARDDVAGVEPSVYPETYRDPMFGTNRDATVPFLIPGEGLTVPLNAQTHPFLLDAIRRYERRALTATSDSTFALDGAAAASYTFAQDYYFLMGDSRDNSVDSRFWGLVPETHLVGKAVFTFLSFKGSFPFIRPTRFFRPIP